MIYHKIGAGTGYGSKRLVAFDDALLESGVGNYNLMRLSSILSVFSKPKENIDLPLGSILPIAYASYTTGKSEGTVISAAVAIGYPEIMDSEHCAVIMEYEGECSLDYAIKTVEGMVKEAFQCRGWNLSHIESKGAEGHSEPDKYVSVFAYVAEWSEDDD